MQPFNDPSTFSSNMIQKNPIKRKQTSKQPMDDVTNKKKIRATHSKKIESNPVSENEPKPTPKITISTMMKILAMDPTMSKYFPSTLTEMIPDPSNEDQLEVAELWNIWLHERDSFPVKILPSSKIGPYTVNANRLQSFIEPYLPVLSNVKSLSLYGKNPDYANYLIMSFFQDAKNQRIIKPLLNNKGHSPAVLIKSNAEFEDVIYESKVLDNPERFHFYRVAIEKQLENERIKAASASENSGISVE